MFSEWKKKQTHLASRTVQKISKQVGRNDFTVCEATEGLFPLSLVRKVSILDEGPASNTLCHELLKKNPNGENWQVEKLTTL